ncbi:DUF6531 domain-containing protein [Kitasatospora sp. NPDC127116]|uniref:DUF6531 domain-containing protein n=1 Tax=Kitasatospora sp. NPDC127116 TaxID=3345367 RepID=UPI00362E8CF3
MPGASQWMVYEATGWCSLDAPIQRGVNYYVKVRYGYADGSSDELTSVAAPPVPIVGVPDNVSLACPDSPSSTGIVLSLVKYCADPVNTSTGAFGEAVTDAELPGPGQPFRLTRSYSSSSSTASGVLGKGWVFPYSASLVLGQSVVTFRAEDGSQVDYAVQTDGSLKATRPYVRSVLQKQGAGYRLTTPDRRQLMFDSNGRLTAMVDAAGIGLTMSYTGSQLTGITDGAGRTVGLAYTGGLLTSMTVPGQRTVAYQYTGNLVTGVRDLRGQSTSYGYDANGRLSTVTDPLGHVVTANTYDGSGRVAGQVDALGGTTTFSYDTANSTTYVTHPDGGIWTHAYSGGVISWQSDPYGKTTRYTYDSAFNRTAFTDPNGNTSTFTFDANGNMLTSTAPAPVSATQTWTYDGNNNVTSQKDALGRTITYAYNTLNQLTGTTDPAGGKTGYTYTALGALATVTTPRGATTTYGYDAAGNRTSVTTPLGEKTTFTYDTATRLTSKTDPRGNAAGANAAAYTTAYTYDAGGLLTSATDPLGNTTAYGYDNAGNLTSVKNPLGATTAYGYDNAGNRTTVKDSAGSTTSSVYDPAGNPTAVTDALGNQTTYGYDKNNRHIKTVTARGNTSPEHPFERFYTWTYGYDANGNLTSTGQQAGGGLSMTYDAVNRLLSVTTQNGRTTSTTYDAAGQAVTTTDPTSAITTLAYDALGRPTSRTDARGKTTSYGYDADGNRTSLTTPEGNRTTWTYDLDQRPTGTVDPRGNATGATAATYTTAYAYDPAGNPTSLKDPLGNTITTGFDPLNRPTTVTDPLGRKTTTGYDAAGRVTTVTDPNGAVTTNTWNAAGERTKRTDANGHVTGYAYDQLHRITAVTDPLGRTTRTWYDEEGNRSKTTDARGVTSETKYDPRGFPMETVFSDGTPKLETAYDGDNRLVHVANGTDTRDLGYDPAGRLASVTKPNETTGFAYAYDTVGNITSRQYPDGRKTTYTYDADGRRTQQTVDGATTTYTYDPAGHLATTALPASNGHTEARSYDPAGRLSGITSAKGATTLASWQITRDANGRPAKVDTTRAGLPPGTQNYTYDNAGRLLSGCPLSTTTTGCAGGTLTYSYDQVGNRLTQSDPAGTTTYTYDAADQLTKTTAPTATTTYGYDANGNNTTVTAPANNKDLATGTSLNSGASLTSNTVRLAMQSDGNLVLSSVSTNQTLWSSGTAGHPGASATMQADGNLVVYDTGHNVLWASNTPANPGAHATLQDDGDLALYNSAGSRIWKSDTAKAVPDTGNLTYTYDAAGRLTTATGKSTQSFTYDPLGNRATSTGTNTPARTITWDINNPLPQIATQSDGTGQLIGDYTYNPLGQPQSQHAGNGTFYNHHDWLGSVTDLTSTNGTPQSRTTYDPYGRAATTPLATEAPTSPFGFTGQYNDPGLAGKQYLRAREYDPSLGRFTAQDPLATPAGSPYASAYTYAAGAPTVYTDPTGLSPEDDDPEKMGNLEAIGSGLVKGFKMPFEFVGDVFNAVTGRNGGAGAFVDKYVPVRPAYAMYVAAAKLREFGCLNVADKVEKQADELATQVVLAGLGGVRSWGKKAFGEKADIAGGGAPLRRWWAADVRTTLNGDTYLVPSTPGLRARINPDCGTMNCGLVSLATDQLLAGKNPPPAPAADNPLLPHELQALANSSQPFVQKGGLSGVVSDMLSWGNGSRAIVMGQPASAAQRRGTLGHFFNVINDNGVIVFLDAQSGRAAPEGWRYYYIMRTN